MKSRKMLTICILALGLMVRLSGVSEAAPMGTAWTYQGRLMDANDPADGLYDFQFLLYASFNSLLQIAGPIDLNDVDVIDGYFTVDLDFGSNAFTGDARWLQIGVRPGDSDGTNQYTILGPRQEVTPTPYALYAASGPGVPVPLILTGSSPNAIISGTNFGAGSAVYGKATNTGEEDNHGGYFESAGSDSSGVYGKATGLWGHGVYGTATSSKGRGVYGRASGQEGMGIYGYASNMGDVTNYGGYFVARGEQGRGVYGEATDIGNKTNYGGYFVARGKYGRAVYGLGTGQSGRGVWGESEGLYGIGVQGTASGDNSFGVYGFTSGSDAHGVVGLASGSSSRGVYGSATNTGNVTNYGGYFTAAGLEGRAVYGEATDTGDVSNPVANYGGYFLARGTWGAGIYGEHSPSGNDGYIGTLIAGVYGWSDSDKGVYGHSNSGYGVYGYSGGYAGYFQGKVHVTGTLSKGGGSFKIDHPLDPENKYLQHSFIESPDMMNVYNGNVLLDENGEAVVELPEYFEALNCDFRYQLTCIGGFAPVYIAEKISDHRFKIAGGKKGMEVSWQVTGIRQDAYAKANRIVVEENKSVEERGYYLHPAAYGLPEEKGIEAVHNARFSETRQVAKKVD